MLPYLIGLLISTAVLIVSGLVGLASLRTKRPSWVPFVSLVVTLLAFIAIVVFVAIVVLMASAGRLK